MWNFIKPVPIFKRFFLDVAWFLGLESGKVPFNFHLQKPIRGFLELKKTISNCTNKVQTSHNIHIIYYTFSIPRKKKHFSSLFGDRHLCSCFLHVDNWVVYRVQWISDMQIPQTYFKPSHFWCEALDTDLSKLSFLKPSGQNKQWGFIFCFLPRKTHLWIYWTGAEYEQSL